MKSKIVVFALLVVGGLAAGAYAAAGGAAAESVALPTMGWSSWNTYRVNISEELIKRQADALVANGYAELGYRYVNIDDGWFGGRDKAGRHTTNKKRFPNGLKPVVDHIHAKGLKAGIYSDAGENTCGSKFDNDVLGIGVGLYGHEAEDVKWFFDELGFDFIKIDFCGGMEFGNKAKLRMSERERYTAIAREIDKAAKRLNREIRMNVCCWRFPGEWVADIAGSWRMSGDVHVGWESVKSIIDKNSYLARFQRPGHYNDMDMLQVGRGMSVEEDKTHFGLWCMMASPLLIGCDLTTIKPETAELLKNRDLIAIDQDPLGRQAEVIWCDGKRDLRIYAKPLAPEGSRTYAIACYNGSDKDESFWGEFEVIGFEQETLSVWDCFEHKALPNVVRAMEFTVPAHGTRIYRLSPVGYHADAVLTGTVTGKKFEPGVTLDFQCWAPAGLTNGQGAVYVSLEWPVADREFRETVAKLVQDGAIPPGLCLSLEAGTRKAPEGGTDRGRRPGEFDQPGPDFPSLLMEELLPAAEKLVGVQASRSPDLHFIMGASSGGFAAFNACWYRNDFFRRCYCNSPTFSNIRGGNQLLPLVRKSEGRPIRVYLTAGTDEPDYYFGDSYLAAEDAVSALRYAGYEMRYDRFVRQGHGAAWCDAQHLAKVLTWLFEDWRTKPVAAPAPSMRVRQTVFADAGWTSCDFAMPAPVREAWSSDMWIGYSVDPTNRFVMSRGCSGRDGVSASALRHAPLELAWNASRVGGTAVACAADDRLWVATELGVQGVVSFGITDVVLPLPGDLPCDNVALVGTNLYAASGTRVFRRPVKVGAPDAQRKTPATPGYCDNFWYTREHAPAGGVGELLGSYVTAGRIAGVVSALSDNDYNVTFDCAGWAEYGGRDVGKLTPDSLFAIFSMTKTFTGAAIMCAIDEGKISLDDEVAKYLPEFADVKMKDGTKPKRPLAVRDLMSHVTGFRAGGDVVNRGVPLREVARKLASEPLHAQPGETFWYGNTWVDSAAACLEIAVGESYEKYLQRKILDPLGMKDTTFRPRPDQLKRLVKPYTSDDRGIRRGSDHCSRQLVFPKKGEIHPAASGGLFSTPRDMIRFSQMLAHHGAWKGRTLISRATFDGVFAVKQTPAGVTHPYTCGSWLYGDWFGHEGAMRTDQRANLKTGHSRVFFIQTENAAGPAFFQLKRDWHAACDFIQGTTPTVFGN